MKLLSMLVIMMSLVGATDPMSHAQTPLPIVGSLGTGPAMDVAVEGNRAFVIGRGKLHVVDISEPAKPSVLGSIDGLGNTRQIVVSKGLAYVSARESGLFIVDTRTSPPTLIAHYDSIELATGVAVAGDVLFIAQRHYGVELVDVSDPRRPRHLSTVRTGEAQSIAYHDGMLYTGVWGTSEIVTVDVRDPRNPRIVSKVPLDGYGDGVAVHGGRLFAATGHHSRAAHAKPDDPGFGSGHGLEVFSLADPAQPQFLGRTKFPRFYDLGFDMWDVQVVGTTAFVADTHNGMFVVDVSDPSRPVVVARAELPRPTPQAKHADFVGGFGLVRDYIYAAGGATDLHIIDARGLAHPVSADAGKPPVISPVARPQDDHAYVPDGQVHAVAVRGDVAVAACGNAGIHVLQTGGRLRALHVQPTKGTVTDVCLRNDILFAAEAAAGLSIWRLGENGQLVEIGRYHAQGRPIRYVVVPESSRYALLQVGSATLQIVDISDVSQPRLALEDKRLGLLYGHQLCDQLLAGRYAAIFWHVSGPHWYDLGGSQPTYVANRPQGQCDPLGGLAMLGEYVVTARGGGLVRFDQTEERSLDALPISRAPGVRLSGKPTVSGSRIAVTDRAWGQVVVVDAADFAHLKVVERFTLEGNPGRVVFTNGQMLIPAGYQGLIRRPVP